MQGDEGGEVVRGSKFLHFCAQGGHLDIRFIRPVHEHHGIALVGFQVDALLREECLEADVVIDEDALVDAVEFLLNLLLDTVALLQIPDECQVGGLRLLDNADDFLRLDFPEQQKKFPWGFTGQAGLQDEALMVLVVEILVVLKYGNPMEYGMAFFVQRLSILRVAFRAVLVDNAQLVAAVMLQIIPDGVDALLRRAFEQRDHGCIRLFFFHGPHSDPSIV